MPYRSSKQRGWMHINKPGLAKKWDKKYGGEVVKKAVEQEKKKHG